MNKKEINEIRKLLTPANCSITRICSCYVDAEKNKRAELKEAFLSLPEEEAFKYFTIFKNSLSGTVAKNLINLDFPRSAEQEGGQQEFLLKLRDSQLKDDGLIEEFYDKIIESYDYGENYYIVLIHGLYDIPGKAEDNTDMFDASDYVYSFTQCAICPVKLTKGALTYNTDKNAIENRVRDWIVEAPTTGFLFPAFNDRQTDIHSLLHYAKNPEQIPERLVDKVLGCQIPMTAKSQKETFQAVVEETLAEECDFDAVKGLYETISDVVEEAKDEPMPCILGKYQIKKLLERSGASEEKLAEFEENYNPEEVQLNLVAGNVINTKTFEIKTSDASIKVAPDKTYLVENRMIEGRPCIVIGISDHIEVNGITTRAIAKEDVEEDS